MSTFNGVIASLTKAGNAGITTLLSGVSSVTVNSTTPMKYFSGGQFAVIAKNGVSGTFGVEIIGSIGGASFIIAGTTNIGSVGSYPIPFYTYTGVSSGTQLINPGFPRPAYVNFVSGKSNIDSGFTATVTLCGSYNA